MHHLDEDQLGKAVFGDEDRYGKLLSWLASVSLVSLWFPARLHLSLVCFYNALYASVRFRGCGNQGRRKC